MSEVGAYPCPPPRSRGESRSGDGRRTGGRLVAEWISLGISVLLILGLSGYLLWQGLGAETEHIPVQVRPLWGEVRPLGGEYVVPIEVENQGRRTVRDLRIGITYVGEQGEEVEQDTTIDYLGERSKTRVFVYVPTDPRQAQLEATPSLYRLE
ncbi:MAG: hypothetical protein ACK47B_02060 [Armatimonadota bacterium]